MFPLTVKRIDSGDIVQRDASFRYFYGQRRRLISKRTGSFTGTYTAVLERNVIALLLTDVQLTGTTWRWGFECLNIVVLYSVSGTNMI